MIDRRTTMEELAVLVSMSSAKAGAALLSDGARLSIRGDTVHESAAAVDAGKRNRAGRS